MGTIMEGKLMEINLGRVEILNENTLNIRDVDVHNIPEDIDISLE